MSFNTRLLDEKNSFATLFDYYDLLVRAGRDKRVDRQNVHVSVLMEGLFMVRGVMVRFGKVRRARIDRQPLEDWRMLNYCSNLRSSTDNDKNIMPAQKNQDAFVIVLNQFCVGIA